MEADGAPFTPLPLSILRFTGKEIFIGSTESTLLRKFRDKVSTFEFLFRQGQIE